MLIVGITGAAVAFGEENAKPTSPVKFDIPAQPLIDALQAYSKQTGVQVMFETASATGQRSQPVKGEFMPAAALRVLLAETDLKVHYSRASAVTLAPASAPSPDDPPVHPWASADMVLQTLRVSGADESANHNRLAEYVGSVQSDIQNALERVGKTRRGEYRVAVKMWIDSSRVVQRAELEGSTGDRERDSSVVGALRGLLLTRQAPPNTPQPIRFMISMHAL
jgi:hypothetical protein